MPGEKPQDARGTLLKLIPYLRLSALPLAAAFLAAVLSTAFSVVGPRLLGNATTILFHGISGGTGSIFRRSPGSC
jgi:ATP-binding cassette subfamily B protein